MLKNENRVAMAICERHFELRARDQLTFQLSELFVRILMLYVSCSMFCITTVMIVGSKHILDRVGRMQGRMQNHILRNITYVALHTHQQPKQRFWAIPSRILGEVIFPSVHG